MGGFTGDRCICEIVNTCPEPFLKTETRRTTQTQQTYKVQSLCSPCRDHPKAAAAAHLGTCAFLCISCRTVLLAGATGVASGPGAAGLTAEEGAALSLCPACSGRVARKPGCWHLDTGEVYANPDERAHMRAREQLGSLCVDTGVIGGQFVTGWNHDTRYVTSDSYFRRHQRPPHLCAVLKSVSS